MYCWTCRALSGEARISPGPSIWKGEYWTVEHAYPVAAVGWLVIVLNRHVEALHGLSEVELQELAAIQALAIRALHEETHCEKEYLSCYAEAAHFRHIHFHLFAKSSTLPADFVGAKSFALLRPTDNETVPGEEIAAFCEAIRDRFISMKRDNIPRPSCKETCDPPARKRSGSP
jgi:diadenosine tetraphosphate (Ap4A) HIT family hydrolase